MCFTHLCYERIYVYYYECIVVVYMHICTHILYLISDQYSKKHVYTHAVRDHAIKPFLVQGPLPIQLGIFHRQIALLGNIV